MRGKLGTSVAAAFTLVEVLVVTAIIAVVVAITLPALFGARAAARQTTCLSNIRMASLAMLLYVGEHNDRFGENALSHSPTSSTSPIPKCPDGGGGPYLSNGYLYEGFPPYNGVFQTMIKRPSETVTLGEGVDPEAEFMLPMFWGDPPRIADPEQQALEWDAVTGSPRSVDTRRHSGKANWAFVDHHAKWLAFESLFKPASTPELSIDKFDPLR